MPVASLDAAHEKCRQALREQCARPVRPAIPDRIRLSCTYDPACRSRWLPGVDPPDQGSGQACIHLVTAPRS